MDDNRIIELFFARDEGAVRAALSPKDRNLFLRRYWYLDGVEQLAKRFGIHPPPWTAMSRTPMPPPLSPAARSYPAGPVPQGGRPRPIRSRRPASLPIMTSSMGRANKFPFPFPGKSGIMIAGRTDMRRPGWQSFTLR